MTHEEYLEVKKLQNHYNEIVWEYERHAEWKKENRKKELIKEKFPKGTLITFTGGSFSKKLDRGSQYPVVSIRKDSSYIYWKITIKTEKGEYVQLPEYCFLEVRELNKNLKNESTSN